MMRAITISGRIFPASDKFKQNFNIWLLIKNCFFHTITSFLPLYHKKNITATCIKVAVILWSKCGDSNSRPPVPETGALPTALHLENIRNYI